MSGEALSSVASGEHVTVKLVRNAELGPLSELPEPEAAL